MRADHENAVSLNPPKLAYSPDEAAERIGVCRSYLYILLGSGELPAKKLGKRTLIMRADLETFLAGLQSYGVK